MLTEAEKKWLKKKSYYKQFPVNCYKTYKCSECPHKETCYLWPNDFKDAAEFEARVAVYLAKSACLVCPDNRHGGCPTREIAAHGREHVEACRLKHARLAVEAEMEAESAER